MLNLRTDLGQEATISVTNRLADNSLRHKCLFAGPLVLYVHNCFALARLHYFVGEEETSGKNPNRDADSYSPVIRLLLVHCKPPKFVSQSNRISTSAPSRSVSGLRQWTTTQCFAGRKIPAL